MLKWIESHLTANLFGVLAIAFTVAGIGGLAGAWWAVLAVGPMFAGLCYSAHLQEQAVLSGPPPAENTPAATAKVHDQLAERFRISQAAALSQQASELQADHERQLFYAVDAAKEAGRQQAIAEQADRRRAAVISTTNQNPTERTTEMTETSDFSAAPTPENDAAVAAHQNVDPPPNTGPVVAPVDATPDGALDVDGGTE